MANKRDINKARVLVIDPDKKPEFVYVDLTDKDKIYDEDGDFIGYSSYRIAERLIRQFPGSDDCYIERTCDRSLPHLGIYVDEEGRVKGLKANRKIITQSMEAILIAGRAVIISDTYYAGDLLYNDDLEDDKQAIVDEMFSDFLRFNSGESIIGTASHLSQKESDNFHYYHQEFGSEYSGISDIIDILKSIYGDDIFE